MSFESSLHIEYCIGDLCSNVAELECKDCEKESKKTLLCKDCSKEHDNDSQHSTMGGITNDNYTRFSLAFKNLTKLYPKLKDQVSKKKEEKDALKNLKSMDLTTDTNVKFYQIFSSYKQTLIDLIYLHKLLLYKPNEKLKLQCEETPYSYEKRVEILNEFHDWNLNCFNENFDSESEWMLIVEELGSILLKEQKLIEERKKGKEDFQHFKEIENASKKVEKMSTGEIAGCILVGAGVIIITIGGIVATVLAITATGGTTAPVLGPAVVVESAVCVGTVLAIISGVSSLLIGGSSTAFGFLKLFSKKMTKKEEEISKIKKEINTKWIEEEKERLKKDGEVQEQYFVIDSLSELRENIHQELKNQALVLKKLEDDVKKEWKKLDESKIFKEYLQTSK